MKAEQILKMRRIEALTGNRMIDIGVIHSLFSRDSYDGAI